MNIYMDTEMYRRAADTLRKLAQDMGDTRVRMTNLMGFVGETWQGPASDAFLEVNEWTLKDMERMRIRLEDTALEILNAASVFETAERDIKI
jgi:WXG100 family type VII secretion target